MLVWLRYGCTFVVKMLIETTCQLANISLFAAAHSAYSSPNNLISKGLVKFLITFNQRIVNLSSELAHRRNLARHKYKDERKIKYRTTHIALTSIMWHRRSEKWPTALCLLLCSRIHYKQLFDYVYVLWIAKQETLIWQIEYRWVCIQGIHNLRIS